MRISDWSSDVCSSDLLGASYRSAIFFTTPGQERVARDTIADVDASGLWPGKAVTQVEPAGDFWERSEEHTSELQSLMRISYAVFCLKKKKIKRTTKLVHIIQHI